MDARRHWGDVYDRKDSREVSWYQDAPTLSLDWILDALPSEAGPRIVDVGAGASTLVDHLLEHGYRRLTVLDIASPGLEVARKRLGTRAEGVEWIAGDLLEFAPAEPFDLWHDRAVLHFLREPDQQRRYAEVLGAALKPGGHAIVATFAVGGPTRCSGLEIVQYDAPRLATLLGPTFTLVREAREIHRTPGGSDQLFSYFMLRRSSRPS